MQMHANTNRPVDTASAVSARLSRAFGLRRNSVFRLLRKQTTLASHRARWSSHRMGSNQFPAFSGPRVAWGMTVWGVLVADSKKMAATEHHVFQYGGTGCSPDRASRVKGYTDGNFREYWGNWLWDSNRCSSDSKRMIHGVNLHIIPLLLPFPHVLLAPSSLSHRL